MLNFLKFRALKRDNGFTLVEIIAAILVLAIGVFAVIALSGKSYSAMSLQRNKLIALNLGREEIEILRAARDENWLSTTGCDGTLDACPGYRGEEDGGNCDWRCNLNEDLKDIDYVGDIASGSGPFDDCKKASQSQSLEQNANGFYLHNGTENTPFRRLVIINRDTDDPGNGLRGDLNGDGFPENDLQAKVIVCWKERGGRWEELILEDHFYNWSR